MGVMIKKLSYAGVVIFGALPLVAQAQETASVLPQSIFRGRVVTVFAPGVNNQFNADGNKESLTAAYDGLVIKPADVAAAAALKAGLDQVGQALGADLTSMLDTTFDVKAELNVQQFTTAFEYGLTRKLSLGVIVPVVKMESTASFTRSNSEAEAIATINGVPDGSFPGGAGGKAQLVGGINEWSRMTSADGLGYTDTGSSTFTALGDIEIGGKYQFFNNGKASMAFQAGARLPTATHRANQKNIFDRSSGDGQLDLAAQWMGEYRVNSNLYFGSSAKLTAQLADKEDRYVKASSADLLADLTNADLRDTNVTRNLGDVVDAEASVNYEFGADSFKTWTVYEFSAQTKDKYKGTKGLDYASIGTNTDSISHRLAVGLGYSTIPAFARKKFPVPMEIKASYSFPMAGKNITNAKFSRLDLIAYF